MQEPLVIVKRQIKKFKDKKLGKKDETAFALACQKYESNFKVSTKKITIKENSSLPTIDITQGTLFIPKEVANEISTAEIVSIFNQIIKITRNPLSVTSYLKDFDKNLGQTLQQQGIKFNANALPKTLIPVLGHFAPDYPPEGYDQPLRKGRLLDKLLLQHEKKLGINTQGYAPKFVGFVAEKIADKIVSEGNLFTENTDISRVLFHGSYSHRLMFVALSVAISKGDINLKLKSGIALTLPTLLKILVSIKYNRPRSKVTNSLWEMTIDTATDTTETSLLLPFNVKDYNYSCRSPFVFNSLLVCFGSDLGLPNLQLYLLDSYYKAMHKMILRAKNIVANDIPLRAIYFTCMNFLSTIDSTGFANVGLPCFFALSSEAALANPNYEIINTNVVKRKTDTPIGTYKNWFSFMNEKAKDPISLEKPTKLEVENTGEDLIIKK